MTRIDPKVAAQAEMASRVLSKRRFLPFVQRMNDQYLAGWVHEDICRRLEKFSDDVNNKKSPRLMLLMPPRHGKSELASRSFPAWHLGRFPDHEFIACSYNMDLAVDFSRKVKAILEDPSYQSIFPDTKLDPDNRSAEKWVVHGKRGGYVAAGVGGGITGRGAHVLVIDDPIKAAEDADSVDNREKLWQWYLSTAYSRLAPGAGVLIIQCMTGDTPVLMADGLERRLDTLAVGDKVATYAHGALATSVVKGFRSNGCDSVFKITMSSGKMVRANGRHPFLAATDGELKWIRTRSLTTAHKIAACQGSGGSGKVLPAQQKDVQSQPEHEGSALHTTTRENGQMAPGHQASTPSHDVMPTSSTGMGSPSMSTTTSPWSKAGSAQSAESHLVPTPPCPITGRVSSLLTTATIPARSVGCSATDATQESDILELSPWHLPLLNTSEFTLDAIVSVEPDGVEEVFDLQVEYTENFIANGLVSHNTWWHDDDLAGRLQTAMRVGSDDRFVDQFDVVKYPAIAEADEYLNHTTQLIEYDAPPADPHTLLRHKGEALHPARYDLDKLLRIKAQNKGGRWWSALYQQNPVPDDGGYFEKAQFRRVLAPSHKRCNVFIAWDFAISERKHNDYTVGTVGLQDDNDILHIVDQIRFRSGDAFFIVDSILTLAAKWYSPSLQLGFEDGQIYRSLEALLKKRMRERHVYPPITVLKPLTDKLTRARALQGRMQQGMVSFTTEGEWYDSARQEMLRFPAGAHDDQVDSLAYVAMMAVGREPPARPREQRVPSWADKLFSSSPSSFMAA